MFVWLDPAPGGRVGGATCAPHAEDKASQLALLRPNQTG